MTRLSYLVLALATFFFLANRIEPQSTRQSANGSAISVRLVQPDYTFRPEDPFEVRVEINNVSDQTLLICRDLSVASTKSCSWTFSIHDATGRSVQSRGWSADRVVTKREDFATALITNWIATAPRYSYSTSIDISLAFWQPAAGRYRLSATLRSDGPQGQSIYNDLSRYPDELAKLPYVGWSGDVQSNSIWITVGPSHRDKE